MKMAAVVAALAVVVAGQDGPLPTGDFAPTIIPEPPKPYWNWDRIPLSFHGAVKDRYFTPEEVSEVETRPSRGW